jgi:hypothetical protein
MTFLWCVVGALGLVMIIAGVLARVMVRRLDEDQRGRSASALDEDWWC